MTKKGIDISSWQRGISFDSLKGKVDFIILRAGFTGTSDGVSKKIDSEFETFYKEAKAQKIPVGAYWYSCANTKEKGIAEANYMYENALKGKKFEYPIYIDVENNEYQRVGKEKIADAIIGFCETLEAKGYYVGVYANLNYFDNYIATSRLTKYDKWVAYWASEEPSFKYGDYNMWQNSSSGYIGGYRLDTDVAYLDFPTIMQTKGLNGYSKEETPTSPGEDNNENDNTCEEQLALKEEEIKKLEEENASLKEELAKLQQTEDPTDPLKDYQVFTAPSDDNYYLYLKSGDQVYFKELTEE